MDYNSTKNQDIKQKFVGIHVYSNVNQMVEYILSTKAYVPNQEAPFCYDDITNFYSYPEFINEYANFEGGSYEDVQAEIERLQELITEDNEIEINDTISELENLETEPQEIYEWYIVSSYLMAKLKDLGHPVIEHENIWGRCTTGQAILLDYAISKICEDMQILEGQKNEW